MPKIYKVPRVITWWGGAPEATESKNSKIISKIIKELTHYGTKIGTWHNKIVFSFPVRLKHISHKDNKHLLYSCPGRRENAE